MRTIVIAGLGILLTLAPFELFAAPADPLYKLDIQRKGQASYARVSMTKSGKTLIEIKLPEKESLGDEPAARLEDFNFDGYPDLAVFSSAGNVQIFYNVYLFDPSQQKFIFNKKLSSLPCVEAQLATKTVFSSCNHSSACENWTETYRWSGNRLTLIGRAGTKCSSKPGCYYDYSEGLKNNKLSTIKNKLICE
ncbi:MAG: hypothetical protein V2A66_04955 [Pseudomonadota bacterium]